MLHSDDDTYPANSATRRYLELLVEASHKAGQPFTDIHGLKSRVVDAGFQNVDETKLKAPWGPWAKEKRLKEMGFWTLLILETGFESFGLALMTRVLGMDKTEVDELSQKAFAELKSRKLHIYLYK